MGLLDDLLSMIGLGPAAPPRDHSLGDPQAKQLIRQVQRGNFSGVDAAVGQMRESAWDDRDFLVEIVAEVAMEKLPAADQLFDGWCKNQPRSALAHLLKARHAMFWAWQARGGGTSDTVGDDADRLFGERLQVAEQAFRQAVDLEPADPTPWAHLIHLRLCGLGGDIDLGTGLFNEAIRRDALHRSAHMQMIGGLAHKWSGEGHEPMFEFARKVVARAPEGTDVAMTIAMAHLERWTWDHLFEENDSAAEAYLHDANVRAEVIAAYDKSLGSPKHQPRRSTVHFRNWAAMWFFLTKDRVRLRRELAHLGNAYTVKPWCYYDDEDLAFATAQDFAKGR